MAYFSLALHASEAKDDAAYGFALMGASWQGRGHGLNLTVDAPKAADLRFSGALWM